jgi:hypothetical protein
MLSSIGGSEPAILSQNAMEESKILFYWMVISLTFCESNLAFRLEIAEIYGNFAFRWKTSWSW